MTDTVRCPGCELIAQERDQVPEGRTGYGIKITLLPRQVYEALHHEDQTSEPDPPTGR
ncbi:hypothetical protein [Streptomyces sp. BRA346]|uniref:hypothetical protein n=1 Tax=Streptomyces sp. BRA346 TaxID=2878199 RepID=UPI0040641CB3